DAWDCNWKINVALGDINNDGLSDFIVSLQGNPLKDETKKVNYVFINSNSSFAIDSSLIGFAGGVAFADYDNDGDLDFAISAIEKMILGIDATYRSYKTILYRNNYVDSGFSPNQDPAAPTTFTGEVIPPYLYFTWSGATDDLTPTNSLLYNVRVSSLAGHPNRILSGALSTPFQGRYPPNKITPTQSGIKIQIDIAHLTENNTFYFWVQTIDSGLRRSSWSPKKVIYIHGIPPSPITDLSADFVSDQIITLIWTAPGDDGTSGKAQEYLIRYSQIPIYDETTFNNATPVANVPVPQPYGTIQSLTVTGLTQLSTYYFAIMAVDDVGFKSLSNTAAIIA
ncbi:MAG: FG-GAP-like repeat-containing protein, partial [Elusimicrobiota bacterium]|nr:FG-GAP-like repeat-containing protein [Elusimicrobiota bacterium]